MDNNNHNIDNKNNIDNTDNSDIKLNPDLIYLADSLVLSNTSEQKMLKYLMLAANGMALEYDDNYLIAHVTKARFRIKKQKTNLTAMIREWISITNGNISITDLYQNITLITKQDRPTITVIMNRLIKEGVIERVGKKFGVYRRVENECEKMDFMSASTNAAPIWFPFKLHKLVSIMPGNIIVVAGSPNSGKTGFLLNCVAGNQRTFDTHYFNSEMGAAELRVRLEKFDYPLDKWAFTPWERSSNFADVIKPGIGKLNIIDFLEIHDNFYEIGGMLAEIHRKLDGAIAIIAIQKNHGTDTGLGGLRSLEKPRLYLAMEHGEMKIVKAKNFADPMNNPNGQRICFKVVNGCKFPVTRDWHMDE